MSRGGKIAPGTRFKVFHRDNYRCVYCGAEPDKILLEIDHVIPYSLGGRSKITNLVTACQPCNAGKAALELELLRISPVDPEAWTWSQEWFCRGWEIAERMEKDDLERRRQLRETRSA